jgi:hypothetical protein
MEDGFDRDEPALAAAAGRAGAPGTSYLGGSFVQVECSLAFE